MSWNARGLPAAGPQGPKGDPGAKGDTGAAGPSDVYAAGASFGHLTSSYTQVAAVTLPAGNYVLQAKTTVGGASATSAAAVDCIIAPTVAGGPGTWDEASVALAPITGQVSGGVISLAGVTSLTSLQTVVLACKTIESTNDDFDDTRLWATATGSLHATLPLPID